MTKQGFLKQLDNYLKSKGFSRMKDHFYCEFADDLLLVIGIQQSHYGAYGYMEYGLAVPSINRSMPYPKFNELNINLGRIMTRRGKQITWEEIDPIFLEDIQKALDERIEDLFALRELDKGSLIRQLKPKISYILGDHTAACFGMTRKDFQDVIVVSEDD